MFEWIVSPEGWIALSTLTALESVLGIDNIIFISILVGRLPAEKRNMKMRKKRSEKVKLHKRLVEEAPAEG